MVFLSWLQQKNWSSSSCKTSWFTTSLFCSMGINQLDKFLKKLFPMLVLLDQISFLLLLDLCPETGDTFMKGWTILMTKLLHCWQLLNKQGRNRIMLTSTNIRPLDSYCMKKGNIMNPARGFIIGIAKKFCKPLIEHTKCNFIAPPCWPSNMLKILPEYP